jgi:hypothetical protein
MRWNGATNAKGRNKTKNQMRFFTAVSIRGECWPIRKNSLFSPCVEIGPEAIIFFSPEHTLCFCYASRIRYRKRFSYLSVTLPFAEQVLSERT